MSALLFRAANRLGRLLRERVWVLNMSDFLEQCRTKGYLYTLTEHALSLLPHAIRHRIGLCYSPSLGGNHCGRNP